MNPRMLRLIVTATYIALVLADKDNSTKTTSGLRERNLASCGKKHKSCFPFLDACCTGMTCHPTDATCYRHPRQENDPCVPLTYDCEAGLTCDIRQLRCIKQGKEGDYCNINQSCDSEKGLICDDLAKVCRYPSGEGGQCTLTLPCQSGLYCDRVVGICYAPGTHGDGCIEGRRPCLPGYICNSVSGMCLPPASVGQSCAFDFPCDASLVCNSVTELCESPGGSQTDNQGEVRCTLRSSNCPDSGNESDGNVFDNTSNTDNTDEIDDGMVSTPAPTPDTAIKVNNSKRRKRGKITAIATTPEQTSKSKQTRESKGMR